MVKPPLPLPVAKGRLAPKFQLGGAKRDHDETAKGFAKLVELKSPGQHHAAAAVRNLPESAKPLFAHVAPIEQHSAAGAPIPPRARRHEPDEEARHPMRLDSDGEAEFDRVVPMIAQPPAQPAALTIDDGDGTAVPSPESGASPPRTIILPDPSPNMQPMKAVQVDQFSPAGRQEFKLVSLQTFPPPVGNISSPTPAAATSRVEAPAPVTHTIIATVEMPSVRVLNIKLHPDHLGELTLSLKLRGVELAVNIEAHSGQALEILRKDEGVLRKVLHSAGYDPSSLTIVVTTKDALTPMPVTPAENSDATAQSMLLGGRGAGGDAPPSGQGERRASFARHDDGWRDSDDRAKTASSADRRGDGIFL